MITTFEIKECDVLMTASNRLISKAIRVFTKTKYSHSGMFVKIDGDLYVVEAQKKGVRLIAWADYHKLNNSGLIILRPNFKIKRKELKTIALKDLGNVNYDFFALIHQAIFQATGVWIGRKGRVAAKRKYCTEKTAYDYNCVHGIFPKWWSASPKRLLESEYFDHFILK